MADERVRRPLLLRTVMEILRDAGTKLPQGDVLDELRQRIELTPRELSVDKSGRPRYELAVAFHSGDAATIGWTSKIGGWSITEAGLQALDTYPTSDELWAELQRGYRAVDQRRKQAQESLSDVQQFIADTLQMIEPGSWTAHEDLAELTGTTAANVANFLASWNVRPANAYRVLNADGSVPAEGMLNATYRGTDLLGRLAGEGVTFDSYDLASPLQRLTAAGLKELIIARAEESEEDLPTPARRAWMVRGSSVEGYNLVPQWLREGFVSLSASQLGQLASAEELRGAVERGYEHKSYAYREQRLAEFDRFIRQMSVGDLIVTTVHGDVHIGEVLADPAFANSEGGLSNLRRPVRWYDPGEPIDANVLGPPVPALLQSQAYVVDLTEAFDQLANLVPQDVVPEPAVVVAPIERRQLAFNPITPDLAKALLLDSAELVKITDLLWERRQIILYGPPGTGKTYLARKLARHLTETRAVKLVQFHPSYTYEDFFEGFRPEAGEGGSLTFKLRAGPFRRFAEAAEDDKGTPYILIIDEINRANLAKVFGELYFLLEYRNDPISLQYSPESDKEFSLPENLFIIGTMNTADRSIARIDAAMRRRFAFVELHPRIPPVRGLLGRWLADRQLPPDAALLLDALNDRIEDSEAAIGPSYLMDEKIYQREDGLARVWQYSIMPLLEDLFYGQHDLADRYGLASLRDAVGAATSLHQPAPQDAATESSNDMP